MTLTRKFTKKRLTDIECPVHFASSGDPFFEQVIEEFQRSELLDCIVLLTENVPDINVEDFFHK